MPMINDSCDHNIQELKSFCSPDLEFLTIKCRPYYLPREFSSIIVTAVYIPQANTSTTLKELHWTLCKLETIHPETLGLDHALCNWVLDFLTGRTQL